MNYIKRMLEKPLQEALARGKSVLLLGPRQTGKTTLLGKFQVDWSLSLALVRERLRLEKDPGLLIGEVEALAETLGRQPLIVIDEIQKIPLLLDNVQYLIDRKTAQFILTGSSARKLRSADVNLLPGRVVVLHLDPLLISELQVEQIQLENLLYYGSLPGIMTTPEPANKEIDLYSYVSTYLEEEVRQEALTRDIGSFARFLELAASESGQLSNFNKMSRQLGIPQPTIANYYQILEDCLIAERIEAMSIGSTRRRLSKAAKYIFFDLGVRRLAAHEGTQLPAQYLGYLFEQWVALELIRLARFQGSQIRVQHWHDSNGAEVDWVLVKEKQMIPIEVKWTDSPHLQDARHLKVFLQEYDMPKGYIICRAPRPLKLNDQITAIPWQMLNTDFLQSLYLH